jgi:hypothetical protein
MLVGVDSALDRLITQALGIDADGAVGFENHAHGGAFAAIASKKNHVP